MPDNKPALTLGRPKDKSFEAYKEWLHGMADVLGAEKDISDEDLKQSWIKFWGPSQKA